MLALLFKPVRYLISPCLCQTSGKIAATVLFLLLLTACQSNTALKQTQATVAAISYGENPALVEPETSLIPTINIAKAVGWQQAEIPTSPIANLVVNKFAGGLDHPRWLYRLPNGDILVAQSNKPDKKNEAGGFVAWVQGKVMAAAGAGVKSADRITLLRDTNNDGVADLQTIFLQNLHSPFGMALVDNTLYVANTDAIVAYPYEPDQTQITAAGRTVTPLPAGEINHHWTKNLLASHDGRTLYVTVGSNSNIGENGFDVETQRAAILAVDIASGLKRIFASGLRNPVGMAWVGNTLWTVVNERDELGDNLVPDYMTSVQENAFYGWPYSYFGQNVDTRVEQNNPQLVQQAIKPDYALGAHTASLGLLYSDTTQSLGPLTTGMYVGQHGSWNRKPRSGYKVVFVPFTDGLPAGLPQDVLRGFLNDKGQAQGRPVGVIFSQTGDLLVADDVGNVIWRVSER
ncbi:MAG: glucose/arabinose dehydrogenase [Paraglaciecola sp.]|jgi:glucose/arabinose dehydrogenase